jgi:hypothetical protein
MKTETEKLKEQIKEADKKTKHLDKIVLKETQLKLKNAVSTKEIKLLNNFLKAYKAILKEKRELEAL